MDTMSGGADRVTQIQVDWARERPDIDTTPQGIIGRLHRLAIYLTDELSKTYKKWDLGEGEFDVLAALRRAGVPFERAPSELAAHTMVTTGAMTKRIDRLVLSGLVERRAADTDGRRRIVALTSKGLAVIDEAFAEHIANEHRLVGQLSSEDRAAIEPILTRWLQIFE